MKQFDIIFNCYLLSDVHNGYNPLHTPTLILPGAIVTCHSDSEDTLTDSYLFTDLRNPVKKIASDINWKCFM